MNWKTPINIKCSVFILIPLLQFVISPAFAEVKTFEKKYTYRASELENEASSKAIGRAQAEGLLYRDLGNYLFEHTEAKLFLLGPKEIRTMVSALVRVETVLESKDGKSFSFSAKIATDPQALVRALNSLRMDSQRSKDLVEIGRELETALIKIDDLRKKLSSKGADASGEKQYRRAVDDLIAWNLCLEGYRLLISDKEREAVEAFTKAIELQKEERFFYLCRERIFEKIGDYQKAKGDLDRLIELSPRDEALYLKRAALEEKRGNIDTALEDCTRAVEINSGSSEAYYQRGRIYEKTGNLPLAINDYHRAIEKTEEHQQGKASLAIEKNKTHPQAKASLAQAYQKLGKRDTPKEYYDSLIAHNPKQMSAYYGRGVADWAAGRYEKAIKDYDIVLQMNPRDERVYLLRSIAYGRLGNYKKALNDYQKALETNPRQILDYGSLTKFYGDGENYARAIREFRKIKEMKPADATGYLYRGIAWWELGEYERAIEDFNNVMKLVPKDTKPYLYRGIAYGKLGNFAQTVEYCSMAIAINRKEAMAYYIRARAYEELWAFDESLQDMITAAWLGLKAAQDYLAREGFKR
jgi:tetratricopeptide (TPR) repeat protein